MDESTLRFRAICRKNGLDVAEYQIHLLEKYITLLQDWNERVNLISRAEKSDIWFKHILHSISPLFFFPWGPGLSVLDLGTGGGMPGIPIAILKADLKVVLLDSIRKKIAAVQDITSQLALPNTEVIVSRAEDLPKSNYIFDIVLARAVAPLVDLLKWSTPLLRKNGSDESSSFGPCLIAYKGGDISAEIQAANRRFPSVLIETRNIVFDGSDEIDLQEKKLVLARP